MPEGPEMYRVAQRVERAVAGRPLQELWCAFAPVQAQAESLRRAGVARVTTLGKALLLMFGDGHALYTHNQLYGRWRFSRPDRRPDTRRQLRLAIATDARAALLYSASTIELLAPGEHGAHPFVQRAGLDLLGQAADVAQVTAWIGQARFARRQLGHLLLDQGFLAGVGNYLRSEILFVAGLPPAIRPGDLDAAGRQRLAVAAHSLMWRSVQTGGITNDPQRAARLKTAGWRRRDYRHFVFGRAGQACFSCDAAIERVVVSGRRLYLCPSCQAA
jgi:endonuclease-8